MSRPARPAPSAWSMTDRARVAINSAESLLAAYNRLWGTQRLLLRGIAAEVARPLKVEDVDLATPQQSGSLILFLVAFYGLFASMMGGMAPALDASGGERNSRSASGPRSASSMRW